MSRIITILLCLCFAVMCAFIGFLGFVEREQASVEPEYQEITCAAALESETPFESDGADIKLTDFKNGKSFVPHDFDEDGVWEQVLIPFFPDDKDDLGPTYNAVVVCFGNVKNKEELQQVVAQSEIPAKYWTSLQEFSDYDYSALAQKYPSMNFKKCVQLHSGFPNQTELGGVMFYGAGLGIVFSLLIAGWQSSSMLFGRETPENAQDNDPDEVPVELISNKFGLPTDDQLMPLS